MFISLNVNVESASFALNPTNLLLSSNTISYGAAVAFALLLKLDK